MCETQMSTMDIMITNPELCGLLDCDEVSLYIDGEFFNHDDLPTDVRVISSIQSNGTVEDGEFFRFYAGDSIVLLPFFEVELGGIFEANIEDCQTMSTMIEGWSDHDRNSTKEQRKNRIIEAYNRLKN